MAGRMVALNLRVHPATLARLRREASALGVPVGERVRALLACARAHELSGAPAAEGALCAPVAGAPGSLARMEPSLAEAVNARTRRGPDLAARLDFIARRGLACDLGRCDAAARERALLTGAARPHLAGAPADLAWETVPDARGPADRVRPDIGAAGGGGGGAVPW